MDAPTSALVAALRLSRARNVGPVTFRKLIRVFGSAEAALAAPRDRLLEVPDISPRMAEGVAGARDDPWAFDEFERARQRGVKILTLDDPQYPRALPSVALSADVQLPFANGQPAQA